MHIKSDKITTMPEKPIADSPAAPADSNSKDLSVNRYNCEYDGCLRTYSTVGNLRTHMKTHKGKLLFVMIS